MYALGRHILGEMYGCEAEILNNRDLIERAMVESALEAGAEIREVVFHRFSPQGVSGVVVISESHLAIHTWPELNYAAVDVFTCGDNVNPWDACNYLAEKLVAEKVEAQEIRRGILDKIAAEQKKIEESDMKVNTDMIIDSDNMSKQGQHEDNKGKIKNTSGRDMMLIDESRLLSHTAKQREEQYLTTKSKKLSFD